MQKVLIISAPFFDYQKSVGNAFQALGYEVKIETYDEPIHPFKGLLKWRHKFSLNKEALREKSRQKYKKHIEGVFNNYKPEIVFTYNGTILKDETLDHFRKNGAKVIVWMYDSVRRADRKMCEPHIDHADAFFCFEETDVKYYREHGKTAFFLPLACDTNVYYPIEEKEREIDILFVGTIYTSEKRIKLLESIAEKYPDKKILFYGEYKPYFKNPIKWITRKYRNVFLNHNIAPEKVNELFSRTKIALNIHHAQTFHGANQRVFEACGAKAYQICDSNPYIKSLFQNGEVGLYNNETEMLSLIDWALNPQNAQEREEKAQAAHKIIIDNHTFVKRVEQMLDVVNNK